MAVPLMIVAAGAIVMWARHSPARPVTVSQAAGRFHSPGLSGAADHRPAPGVYQYSGTGVDRLSLPSLSQVQGPAMPVTVTLVGPECWTMRVDYSTHHWQTWDFCRQGDRLVQTGGRFWQLWQVGPLNVTNLTNLTCSPPKVVVPATLTPGQTWEVTGCGGTSTAVKGEMTATSTYRYLGEDTVMVGGRAVPAHHMVETQVDGGSQQGSERYETWTAVDTGLPLRMVTDIKVTTSTMFGNSTYAQTGTLSIGDLQPAR